MAAVLQDLGFMAKGLGDSAAAQHRFQESMAIAQELGNTVLIPAALEGFAIVAAGKAQPARALRLAGAAARLRELIGIASSRVEQRLVQPELESASRALGKETAAQAWAEGLALPQERAIADALHNVALA